jgi:hypothetical protein
MLTRVALAVALAVLSITAVSNPLPTSGGAEIPTEAGLKIAFIGDSGNQAPFASVLNLIAAEGVDAVIHEGDFDYNDDPNGFFATINSILGPAFPYFLAVGNHDMDSWAEGCGNSDGCYATLYKQRLASQGVTIDHPNINDHMYSFVFRGLKLVFVGEDDLQAGDCETNTNGYACYIRNELTGDQHIWKVCNWHKNQAATQVGGKEDDMGWPVFENCKGLGAIIANGHEHSYERTKTLTNIENQAVDVLQHPLAAGVPGNPNNLRVAPGASFVVVSGLGGASTRDQERCLPTAYPYGCKHEWASIYTLSQTGGASKFGALFLEFNVDADPRKARGYFKTTSGEVPDTFEVRSEETPVLDTDADGVHDPSDNCPAIANVNQANADSDGFGDACDQGDFDGDLLTDQTEHSCGSPLNDGTKRPERTDGSFAASDDDGDTLVNEALPAGAGQFDCDGDGYNGLAEISIYGGAGGRDQDSCGINGWPADLVGGAESENSVTIGDIGSFFVPIAYFNTNLGTNPNEARWNLVPQPAPGAHIGLQDIGALLTGPTATPQMFGGLSVFNGPVCPWSP